MPEIVVNNANAVFDAKNDASSRRAGRDVREGRSESEAALLRQLRKVRREIEQIACSSTWAEDCLYRGAAYAPDFRCSCPACRTLFPNRRYPRAVRESSYSTDCQVESDEDPELAEELALLRNERVRIGSVFLRRL